jgi:NAD(P)-dependent dehydrogenase (short-subunit alcohol dehydrogenase family)
MHVTRHAVDVLKRRGGSIVNVAADSGLGFGAEDRPAYCAAKAGVVRLTAALRSLQDMKIRVNCIAPDAIGAVDEFAAAAVSLALQEDCAGRVALYRAGKPLELVEYGDPGYRQLQTLHLT